MQKHLGETRLVIIDEISMVGRSMLGRIASRMDQAKPNKQFEDASLGGTSLVCVGDPGQCQALWDQQLYDRVPHKATAELSKNLINTLF